MVSEQTKEDAARIREMFEGGAAPKKDKRADMLEKVRGLLAKAEATDTPEEAEVFRAGADKLMTAFAIEQWMVEQAQDGTSTRPKPEQRFFDWHWWYRSEFSDTLYSLFVASADHCRCVIAWRGQGKSGKGYHEMPVIGLPSDLDYLDMLFTHLMLEMSKRLEPKPDTNESFGENAYRLRASGMARPRVAKLLYDAGLIPGTGEGTDYWEPTLDNRIEYRYLPANKEKSLRAKVRVAGEKWGREHGFDPTTIVNPKVWQRSFSSGFVQGVREHMRELRRLQDEAPSDGGPSMAVALRDIRSVALELYNELYPPPPPVKIEPGKDVVKSSGRMPRLPALPKTSERARQAGRKAGREANLSAHPSKGIRNNPRPLPPGQ